MHKYIQYTYIYVYILYVYIYVYIYIYTYSFRFWDLPQNIVIGPLCAWATAKFSVGEPLGPLTITGPTALRGLRGW